MLSILLYINSAQKVHKYLKFYSFFQQQYNMVVLFFLYFIYFCATYSAKPKDHELKDHQFKSNIYHIKSLNEQNRCRQLFVELLID